MTRFVSALSGSLALFGVLGAAACTETPSYLPPCVDPQIDPCDSGPDGDAAPLLDGSRASKDALTSGAADR